MRVAAPSNILIKQLLRKQIGRDFYRFYETVQANGAYPSLIGQGKYAAESCRHERIGQYQEFTVARHSDLVSSQSLFRTVLVLQAEFHLQPVKPPDFYVRNDLVIEPFTGKLFLLLAEDLRKTEETIFKSDKSVWDLYREGLFKKFMPQIQGMMENFMAIARQSAGHSLIWGLGVPAGPGWPSAPPLDDLPLLELDPETGPGVSKPEAIVARLREIGGQRMTQELAREIFGVSGSREEQAREAKALYLQIMKAMHPDRHTTTESGLLAVRQLNAAFDLLKR
ncbi:MAG: hypothetical protein WC529_01965 [Candidatus Margulisiibacteriota bacterium]